MLVAVGVFVVPSLAVAGAVAVSVPIAIHLLSRVRRQRVAWGAMQFIYAAMMMQKRKLRFEQWLLLTIRCLLVGVLGLALAGPMLRGGIGGLFGDGGASRHLHLVIDNSVAMSAETANGQTRLDIAKDSAKRVLDEGALWQTATVWEMAKYRGEAGRKVGELVRGDGRGASMIDQIELRYSGTDLYGVLNWIEAATRQPGGMQDEVVVLSGFGRNSSYLQGELPTSIRQLDEKARLVISEPMDTVNNTQITSLETLQALVSEDESGAMIARLRLKLKRSVDLPALGNGDLIRVQLRDDTGRLLGTINEKARWTDGETDLIQVVSVPVDEGIGEGSAVKVMVSASLVVKDKNRNALLEDDHARAVIVLRRKLKVGVIGDQEDLEGRSKGAWLRLAFDPEETGIAGGIEWIRIDHAGLHADLDGVMLLDPASQSQSDWDTLEQYIQAGGVLWLFGIKDGGGQWARWVREVTGSNWQIDGMPEQSDAGMSLKIGDGGQQGFSRLGVEMTSLLRPVWVKHWNAVQSNYPEDIWMRVDDGSSKAQGVVAVRQVGRGKLVYWGVPLDVTASNLMTKPAFLPVVHELLRSALGGVVKADQRTVIAGEQKDELIKDVRWLGDDKAEKDLKNGGNTVRGGGVMIDGEQWIVRQIDVGESDGGTITRAQMGRMFDGLGQWETLSWNDPGKAMAKEPTRTEIGWYLLWVLLVLAIMESILARYMSYAHDVSKKAMFVRLWLWIKLLRHGKQGEVATQQTIGQRQQNRSMVHAEGDG